MHPGEIDDLELNLLIEGIRRRWGVDLRDYARPSLKRRVAQLSGSQGPLAAVVSRLLRDEEFFERTLSKLMVSVTEFFRDPSFFKTLRTRVIPELATYPRPKLWHAGCATGEEVYSTAILLKEAGLLHRTRIYATDISLAALRMGKAGVYPLADVREAEDAYRSAGGHVSFDQYFFTQRTPGKLIHARAPRQNKSWPCASNHSSANRDLAMAAKELRNAITWSPHNLGEDAPFAEVNLILCRNTLIYFARDRQERAMDTFRRSLVPGGFLALGSEESLEASAHQQAFDSIDRDQRIYRLPTQGAATWTSTL